MAAEDERKTGMIEEAWHIYLTTGNVPDFVGAPWYHSNSFRYGNASPGA